MIGAFVAAVVLEVGKRSMGAYLGNALSIRQLYGSLALTPLFMFWVYLMWLVILFGLEVSATLQMLGGRRLEELEQKRRASGLVDPAAVLMVMRIVAEQFGSARPVTAREISERTAIGEATVALRLSRLEEEELVHRLVRPEDAVSLSRPPEQISGGQLLEIGYQLVQEATPGPLLSRLREAQKAVLSESTLATLVLNAPPAPSAE